MKAYIDFLQYSLSKDAPLPESFSQIDWSQFLIWAEQQAIVGVIYGGIQKGGKALSIPFDSLMEWIGYAQQIELQNRKLDKKCVEVISEYEKDGYKSLLLKGQGNAMMYPSTLHRTPGDIDILITNKSRQEITQYVRKKGRLTGHHYHHIEYEDEAIPVEVHFFACSLNNPIYRRRLNNWLLTKASSKLSVLPEGLGNIPVPTYEYNIVFQLAHMMHHFFEEGIGLRQFIDYYYLLRSVKNVTIEGSNNVCSTLKYLNLYKFAGAVMYVMNEVLGLEKKYLFVPVDEKRGKTLLNEILKGGNFGKADVRWKKAEGRWHMGKKYLLKTKRNLHFVREYPAEVLCEPIFRTWHFLWRLAH